MVLRTFIRWRPTENVYTAETDGEDDVVEEEASIKGERQRLDLFLFSNASRFKCRIWGWVRERAPILELSKIIDVFLGFWVLEFLVSSCGIRKRVMVLGFRFLMWCVIKKCCTCRLGREMKKGRRRLS